MQLSGLPLSNSLLALYPYPSFRGIFCCERPARLLQGTEGIAILSGETTFLALGGWWEGRMSPFTRLVPDKDASMILSC